MTRRKKSKFMGIVLLVGAVVLGVMSPMVQQYVNMGVDKVKGLISNSN